MVRGLDVECLRPPICGISKKCMRSELGPCKPDNFACICEESNSLAKNKVFGQQCVLEECWGDVGLRQLTHALVRGCASVNRNLTDVPDRWAIYLPPPPSPSAPAPSPSPSRASTNQSTSASPAAPTVDPSSTILLPPPPVPSQSRLPDATIAGISVGCFIALACIVGATLAYFRTRQKTRSLLRENAVLADQLHPNGVDERIWQIMHGGGDQDDFHEMGAMGSMSGSGGTGVRSSAGLRSSAGMGGSTLVDGYGRESSRPMFDFGGLGIEEGGEVDKWGGGSSGPK